MAESDIGTRIISIIEGEKSPANFCRKAGWTSGDISNIRKNSNSSVGYIKLKGILDAYPSVSAEWLMRGEGEMNRNETSGVNVQVANGGLGHALTQHNGTTTVELLLASLRDKEEIISLLKQKVGELEK